MEKASFGIETTVFHAYLPCQMAFLSMEEGPPMGERRLEPCLGTLSKCPNIAFLCECLFKYLAKLSVQVGLASEN